jgi:hypothetical protein
MPRAISLEFQKAPEKLEVSPIYNPEGSVGSVARMLPGKEPTIAFLCFACSNLLLNHKTRKDQHNYASNEPSLLYQETRTRAKRSSTAAMTVRADISRRG